MTNQERKQKADELKIKHFNLTEAAAQYENMWRKLQESLAEIRAEIVKLESVNDMKGEPVLRQAQDDGNG